MQTAQVDHLLSALSTSSVLSLFPPVEKVVKAFDGQRYRIPLILHGNEMVRGATAPNGLMIFIRLIGKNGHWTIWTTMLIFRQ